MARKFSWCAGRRGAAGHLAPTAADRRATLPARRRAWQVSRPALLGRGLAVRIDGRRQEDMVPINFAPTAASSVRGFGFRRGVGMSMGFSPAGPSGQPLVLLSQRVGEAFRLPEPPAPPAGMM